MKYEVCNNSYTDLVKNIKEIFASSSHILYEGRNTLKSLFYLDEKIVTKSFKIPHIINKVAYTFFRDSKAEKSYKNSLKIIDFVPQPIAYVEFFRWGLLHDSYFLSENFEYDFTIRETLLQNDFKDKGIIFKAFAKFTYDLHTSGIEHLDYSPGNILIKKIDGNYIFKIIDINRMKFRNLNTTERLENFSKLWAKDEDLILIVKAYAQYIDMDEKEAILIALKASQKHKDKKNFKKRLKGKKDVV